MALKVLLVGRTKMVVDDAKSELNIPDLELLTATSLAEVQGAFEKDEIPHVFMGAGIELERRLDMVRAVFEASDATTVHLKDVGSGPKGFLPFVKAILENLPRPTPAGR